MHVVEFMKAIDYGGAAEFLATGVQPMHMLSPSIVRISFVRNDLDDNGEQMQRVSGHIDCDIAQVDAILALIRQGVADLECEGRTQARNQN
jgi:hypothetical protein